MRADATSFLRLTASARDTSRRLRAPQTPRPRSPFHPARRVRTRPTARHPGRNSLRTTPRCCPWLRGGRPPRAPRSAGQHHSSRRRRRRAEPLQLPGWQRDAPAGEASSSGTAPQGRSEADIGKDAARRQQKREGGRSSAERMFDVRFERWLRLAFELRGFTRRACSSPRGRDRREAGLRLRSRAEFRFRSSWPMRAGAWLQTARSCTCMFISSICILWCGMNTSQGFDGPIWHTTLHLLHF